MAIMACQIQFHFLFRSRSARKCYLVGSGSSGNIFFGSSNKGGPAKNLYAKSERPVLNCRVTWAWSESVNLHSRQIVILPRNTVRYKTYSGSCSPSGSRVSLICTDLYLPCIVGTDGFVGRCQRFGRACCLHFQGRGRRQQVLLVHWFFLQRCTSWTYRIVRFLP